ncbi:hypothetical protein JHD50_09395 [Sulfurimonas sp. MAG313]|nr:hypothetical protein [Sulfurimonas sp. MAG313]MDF1881512.1 hypothetical protein [Sulfurimonas sp. MAG313]
MIVDIKQLLSVLYTDRKLFEALFEKRNRLVGTHEVNSLIAEDKLDYLLNAEILIQSDDCIELDDRVLSFFEEFLETNEDVEIGDVDELLINLKYNIELYQNEKDNEHSRERYLAKIKRILKKIPNMILKNLSLLQLHIGLTYKTQSSHKNKILELEHYKLKLDKLMNIESKVQSSLSHEEGFFNTVSSHESVLLSLRLKVRLRELRISLIELQKQVIEYINKTLHKQHFFEHIIKLKEMKSALEIKEKTNILRLLKMETTPLFMSKPQRISTLLDTEEVYEFGFSEMVSKLKHIIVDKKVLASKAEELEDSFFEAEEQLTYMIDIQSLHDEFLGLSKDLFSFINEKDFEFEQSLEDKITLYCQLALMYESEYEFDENKRMKAEPYEYLYITPKKTSIKELNEPSSAI